MGTTREELRRTFDEVAELYEKARPGYPDQLFDGLFEITGLEGPQVLEIGCGTGQATIPLADRQCSMVCVELGENLAAVARRKLARFPGVSVERASFEDWEPQGAEFDLVFAATSWHWLDPSVRYAKAARVLRPGGFLAIVTGGHAFPAGFDPFFSEIQEVYEEIGDVMDCFPPPEPDRIPDETSDIEQSGFFEMVGVRRYLWAVEYSAEQYIDLLNTFSGHISMDSWKRDRLYSEIPRRMASKGLEKIVKHNLAILNVARRLG